MYRIYLKTSRLIITLCIYVLCLFFKKKLFNIFYKVRSNEVLENICTS